MKRSIFKPVLFGVLFGAAAFFAPFFLLKVLLAIMIISFICRMFWWRSWPHNRMQYRFAYADKLRGMSDEEYAAFKSKAGNYNCCGHDYDCCDHSEGKTEAKSGGTGAAEKK